MSAPTSARYPVLLLALFVGMLALGTDEFVISGIPPEVAWRSLELFERHVLAEA